MVPAPRRSVDRFDNRSYTSNRTTLDTISQKCLDKNTFINATLLGRPFDDDQPHRITLSTIEMLGCLPVSLSAYLADAILRAQNNFPTYFVASGHISPYQVSSFSMKTSSLCKIFTQVCFSKPGRQVESQISLKPTSMTQLGSWNSSWQLPAMDRDTTCKIESSCTLYYGPVASYRALHCVYCMDIGDGGVSQYGVGYDLRVDLDSYGLWYRG